MWLIPILNIDICAMIAMRVKTLKLLVSDIQSLQNAKFVCCQINLFTVEYINLCYDHEQALTNNFNKTILSRINTVLSDLSDMMPSSGNALI